MKLWKLAIAATAVAAIGMTAACKKKDADTAAAPASAEAPASAAAPAAAPAADAAAPASAAAPAAAPAADAGKTDMKSDKKK